MALTLEVMVHTQTTQRAGLVFLTNVTVHPKVAKLLSARKICLH